MNWRGSNTASNGKPSLIGGTQMKTRLLATAVLLAMLCPVAFAQSDELPRNSDKAQQQIQGGSTIETLLVKISFTVDGQPARFYSFPDEVDQASFEAKETNHYDRYLEISNGQSFTITITPHEIFEWYLGGVAIDNRNVHGEQPVGDRRELFATWEKSSRRNHVFVGKVSYYDPNYLFLWGNDPNTLKGWYSKYPSSRPLAPFRAERADSGCQTVTIALFRANTSETPYWGMVKNMDPSMFKPRPQAFEIVTIHLMNRQALRQRGVIS
jgi:hypothetical protein